jgi:diaminopimelate epimerase
VQTMRFDKYQALGNDYVVLDRRVLIESNIDIRKLHHLCDRHYGIGSDGLLIWDCRSDKNFFEVSIINPDGSEAEKSGNGLRILAQYLWDSRQTDQREFVIKTISGDISCQILESGQSVAMGKADFDSSKIPVAGPPREVLQEVLRVFDQSVNFSAVSMGNPHCVIIKDFISAEETQLLGSGIERNPIFPNRTNVQFVQVLDRANIRIEIWERGAGYTLSSGSSSCAAAAVTHRLGLCNSDVNVHMPGGCLSVAISDYWEVFLRGNAEQVMFGNISQQLLSKLIKD